MQHRKLWIVTLLAGFVFAGIAPAQPAAKPASQPASTSAPARFEAVPPPGFVRVAVGSRVAFCEPSDQDWVKAIFAEPAATTRPSTMPADLIQKLTNLRGTLKTALASDLALDKPETVDKLIDEQMIPGIKRVETVSVPIVYLITTREKLKEIVKAGWQNPRYYFNRAADEVAFDSSLAIPTDAAMDDAVFPALYALSDDAAARKKVVETLVRSMETNLIYARASRAMQLLQAQVAEFVHEQVSKPLALKDGQEWFGIGLEGAMLAKYSAVIVGVDSDGISKYISADNPQNPVRSGSINLLHPTKPGELKPEWLNAYRSAHRARSAQAVQALIKKGGDVSIPKVIVAVRKSPPADPEAFVKLIQTSTGVDLTADLKSH